MRLLKLVTTTGIVCFTNPLKITTICSLDAGGCLVTVAHDQDHGGCTEIRTDASAETVAHWFDEATAQPLAEIRNSIVDLTTELRHAANRST